MNKETTYLKRLDQLMKLQDGWLYEQSKAISLHAHSQAMKLYHLLVPEGLVTEYIYPSDVGGLWLEWSKGNNEFCLEILPSGEMECLALLSDRSGLLADTVIAELTDKYIPTISCSQVIEYLKETLDYVPKEDPIICAY